MRVKLDKIQPNAQGWAALCRSGFEQELGEELLCFDLGQVEIKPSSALVVLTAERFIRGVLRWQKLIFARQVWPWSVRLESLLSRFKVVEAAAMRLRQSARVVRIKHL